MFKKSWVVLLAVSFLISGCALTFKKTPPGEIEKVQVMRKELQRLRIEIERLKSEKNQEIRELELAKESLESRFREEIDNRDVKLSLEEKGLVLRFVAEVFFDSGKAELRPEADAMLDKVAVFLEKDVPDRRISIEGHTDNVPIKYSPWKSNWELSAARALSVLHYFTDKKGLDSDRVQATGYGEYQSIDSSETKEGRQKNRRVEIVVLPKKLTKVRAEFLEELGKALEDRQRRIKEYAK
ncbi:MAG: flagellar motor protein MotB [Candidatus Kaelpia aquatica]|nr:flagellar motor protein MotB [Candidatus Kaelpia aquatica]